MKVVVKFRGMIRDFEIVVGVGMIPLVCLLDLSLMMRMLKLVTLQHIVVLVTPGAEERPVPTLVLGDK